MQERARSLEPPTDHNVNAYLGFPPGTHYIVLPRWPRAATLNGLALYDATQPHQRFALSAGRFLLRLRADWLFRLREKPPLPAADWWRHWLDDIALGVVGPVGATAFRLKSGPRDIVKVTALLLSEDGHPLAFVKVPRRGRPSRTALTFLRALNETTPGSFRVPRLLADGVYRDRRYWIQAPLPPGHHRRPPFDPSLIAKVVDDLQSRLAGLERPPESAGPHVPIHGDLIPLNLRVASDGRPWLFDWERAGWGPRLSDELTYWIADLARRRGPTRRKAARVVALLRNRGDHSEVFEAMEWRRLRRPEESTPAEQDLRDAVATLLEVS